MSDWELPRPRYWYYSFLGAKDSIAGNGYFVGTEFNIAEVHRILAIREGSCPIVTWWTEVTQKQYDDFVRYCIQVDGGKKQPEILKLIPKGDK